MTDKTHDSSTVNSRVERVDKTVSPWMKNDMTHRVEDENRYETSSSSSSSSTSPPPLSSNFGQCSFQEYEILKDNLLLYNHAKLMDVDENDKKNGEGKERDEKKALHFLSQIIFVTHC